MINIARVDHLNFNVKNLDVSVEFYSKNFGFKVKEEGVSSLGRKYKIIGISNKLLLALYEVGTTVNSKDVNHFGLHINNFDEALEILKKNDVTIHYLKEYDGIIEYKNSKSIYIEDPDGYEIELSQNFGGNL